MDFDKDKFKNVLHFIIYKCGFRNTVGRTVIHKLLYFSDFNYYKEFNQSITNESYVPKNRVSDFKTVLVAIPNNMTDVLISNDELNYDYFKVQDVNFVLKIGYK